MISSGGKLAVDGGVPVRAPLLVFGRPDVQEAEIDEVVATLRSGWIGTGPKVARFEQEFAEYVGAKHAVAVSSCTAALHLALLSLGVGPGDEVITTPLTFAATANAIVHTGARPVFVDVDGVTQNLCPAEVSRSLTPRTKAILPVHFAGYPCDLDQLETITADAKIPIVQDAAHCIEGTVRGKPIGGATAAACFSFYVTKNLTTIEGGMVTTHDARLAESIKIRGLHGMSKDAWTRYSDAGFKHYDIVDAGFKNNMTDVQASLGLHQLARIETNWQRRLELWERYDRALVGLPLFTPPRPANERHALHLYTIFLDLERLTVGRDQIASAIQAEGIGIGIHYRALHQHPYYQATMNLTGNEFPNARWFSDRTISLPLSPGLSDDEADEVIEALEKVLTHFER